MAHKQMRGTFRTLPLRSGKEMMEMTLTRAWSNACAASHSKGTIRSQSRAHSLAGKVAGGIGPLRLLMLAVRVYICAGWVQHAASSCPGRVRCGTRRQFAASRGHIRGTAQVSGLPVNILTSNLYGSMFALGAQSPDTSRPTTLPSGHCPWMTGPRGYH